MCVDAKSQTVPTTSQVMSFRYSHTEDLFILHAVVW